MNHLGKKQPPREAALEAALRHACSAHAQDRQAPDEELLMALSKLCSADPQSKPIASLLGACFGHVGEQSPAPSLSKILWMAAEQNSFGLRATRSEDPFIEAARRRASGGMPHPSPVSEGALALGAGPWAREIGLLLNEADPQAAARWPWICAMAGAAPELIHAVQSCAPKPSQNDSNIAWNLACATRDGAFLALAKTCPPPDADAAQSCVRLLSDASASTYARRSCKIEKRPALERHEIVAALLGAARSPALASQLLRATCVEQGLTPDKLDPLWSKPLLAAGATLSLGDAFAIVERAQQHTETRCGNFCSSDVRTQCHEAELRAVKLALSMGESKRAENDAPAPFLAAEALPKACPSAAKELEAALDRWASQGFGAQNLKWRKLAGGHTVSIGSAIAGLPRRKSPGPNFEPQIKRWLQALATQGFDFEAKASPKSKSLGERLRSTASLREFWPLVEAQALNLSAKSAPKAAKRTL